MSGIVDYSDHSDSTLLFFILIFLLLFYDPSALYRFKSLDWNYAATHDSTLLFFILIFLVLFYQPVHKA